MSRFGDFRNPANTRSVRAGDRRPVELAGLRPRHRQEIADDFTSSDGGTPSEISVELTRATGARSRGS